MIQIKMPTTDMLNVASVNNNVQGSDCVIHGEGVINCKA